MYDNSLSASIVSIRAPAWGATRYAKPAFANGKVSIRAPAWGATLTTITLAIDTGFQFALPRGERRLHAARPRHSLRFNSRSRVGSDMRPGCVRGCGRGFNSRSRVGSDGQAVMGDPDTGGFNSRSRVGSDL